MFEKKISVLSVGLSCVMNCMLGKLDEDKGILHWRLTKSHPILCGICGISSRTSTDITNYIHPFMHKYPKNVFLNLVEKIRWSIVLSVFAHFLIGVMTIKRQRIDLSIISNCQNPSTELRYILRSKNEIGSMIKTCQNTHNLRFSGIFLFFKAW